MSCSINICNETNNVNTIVHCRCHMYFCKSFSFHFARRRRFSLILIVWQKRIPLLLCTPQNLWFKKHSCVTSMGFIPVPRTPKATGPLQKPHLHHPSECLSDVRHNSFPLDNERFSNGPRWNMRWTFDVHPSIPTVLHVELHAFTWYGWTHNANTSR